MLVRVRYQSIRLVMLPVKDITRKYHTLLYLVLENVLEMNFGQMVIIWGKLDGDRHLTSVGMETCTRHVIFIIMLLIVVVFSEAVAGTLPIN